MSHKMPILFSPAVSVILPSFNRLRLLKEAVASVFNQTLTDWELVVADDGSSDETRAYLACLADARVKILWLTHSGNPSAVRNAALAAASGHYVAFIDSDDAWLPTKLETQLAAMRTRSTCRWSYTDTERVDGRGQPIPNGADFIPYEDGILEACLNNTGYIAMPTVMAERALVNEVGGFDEELAFAEDYDLWVRLGARSEALPLSQPLTRVCLHQENYCHDRIGFCRGWLGLYEKLLPTIRHHPTVALCRLRRAETALRLANLQADRRRTLDVARTIFKFRSCAVDDSKWWRGTMRAFFRSFTPTPLLKLYRSQRQPS